jgi:hypothetical protein
MKMTMKISCATVLIAGCAPAWAGTPYVLQNSLNRAPAVVLHCATGGNVVVPCGTAAMPLVVTGGTGGTNLGSATATNQQSQIAAEQSSATALGTPADLLYSGGSGSVTSLLKGVWSVLGGGVSAVPVGGVPVSRSLSLVAQQSTQVFPSNGARHYLAFQVPQGSYVWVNLLGGAAAPNGLDCAYFAAGTFYESGQYVNRGAITFYSPVAAVLSAWEG